MPLIRSAIKKLRQDVKRTKINQAKKVDLKKVLKQYEANPSPENLALAYTSLDRAAKTGLIPAGRADRKKSRLAKKVKTTKTPSTQKNTPKKQKSVVKKTA